MPAGPTTPSSPTALSGGRYHVRETLGSGGMGIVVRAEDQKLHRDVAIKLLADNLAMNDDARERFQREAQAAARLNHPNVVQVFDVGEEDGRPYFVMELVKGPTLSERLLDADPPGPDELAAIARQSLDALEHSHDAGLIHRDVKPSNLMIAAEGTLKITDFGVAEVAEVEGLTRTGHVLGTLPYLAPERLRGEPASAATDLYALGATLHEVATGAPPKAGEPLPDEIPDSLRALITQCLVEDPSQRPGTVVEARRILEGGAATRVLTADEAVAMPQTTPISARAEGRTAGEPSPSERGIDPDAPTVDGQVPTPARLLQRLDGRAIVIGLGLLIVIAWGLTAGDGAPSQENAEPAQTPTEATDTSTAPPIEPGDDASSSARNIADWIRENSGDG